MKSSQKTVKEKEKTIEDLTKKLKGSLDQEKYLAEKISELEVNNKDLKLSETVKLYGMSLNVPESIVRENLDVICDCFLDHQ